MDTGPSSHPTAETLHAYGSGKLDDAAAQTVRKHLAKCPDCRRHVTEITASGSGGPGVAETGATATDDATFGSFSSPRMSSTGAADATSGDLRDAAEAELPAGTRVGDFGDYELLKVLGEGGMGIVYKARQLSLNRLVALKMIKASRFPSADEVRRFHNESEAVARLDHPNIVPIFEVGQYEDQHYFSMKLIAGESLDRKSKDYLANPRYASELLAMTAAAIHHAHQRGILHRDLKPANILIDSEGRPHVTDFGLAKKVEGDSELTRSGAILGTPAYMAPEQASGKRGAVTTSTDVYGLGAVLYVLLTGRAPFGGDSVIDTLEQVRERPPEPPTKHNRHVSRDLEVICLKCLEKDPRRRYSSADALTEDLKRWLAGEPIAARPVGGAARLWMWCRRNPAQGWAVALVAAAIVVVALISLLFAAQQARHANEQAAAKARISDQAKNLEKGRAELKASLADSDRRLARLFFERAERSFDGSQVSEGLLWLLESWRYAAVAGDPAWQYLARANLSFWRYQSPEVKGVFPDYLSSGPKSFTYTPNPELPEVFGSYLAISRDRRTALTRGEGNTVRLWDVDSARSIGQSIVHEGASVSSPVFSPDSKTIVTRTGDTTAQLWYAASGLPVGQPMVHQDLVSSMAFSPDGKTILTGSRDRTARLWDARTGRPIGRPMVHQDQVWSVVFSDDGKTILTAGNNNTAWLWNAISGQPIGNHPQPIGFSGSVRAFNPDGRTIITAGNRDNAARLWDTTTALPIGPPMVHQSFVTSLAFSPDGKTVATASNDMSARLWDAATALSIGPPLRNEGTRKLLMNRTYVSFSPDSKTLVVRNSMDHTVRLGNVASGVLVGKPMEHRGPVSTVAFSPDGKTIATGSEDRTARLWDSATGLAVSVPIMHMDPVTAVAFSLDGTAILTRTTDGTAHRWNTAIGTPMGQPLESLTLVHSVTFSPDGHRVLTVGGCVGQIAQLWDVATGLPVGQPMELPEDASTATFSHDGKTILTASYQNDTIVCRWSGATGKPVDKPRHLGDAGKPADRAHYEVTAGKALGVQSRREHVPHLGFCRYGSAMECQLRPVHYASGRCLCRGVQSRRQSRSSPAETTRWPACGTLPPASPLARHYSIRLRCCPSHSAPMERQSSLVATIRQRGFGTPPQLSPSVGLCCIRTASCSWHSAGTVGRFSPRKRIRHGCGVLSAISQSHATSFAVSRSAPT